MVATTGTTEATSGSSEVAHPLDPLTASEMEQAARIFRGRHRSRQLRFVSISLREPLKREVLSFSRGDAITRRAFAVAIDRADGKVYEGVAILANGADGSVESWVHRPGVHLDPVELRRRNLIAPEAMPFKTASRLRRSPCSIY